MPRGGDEVGAAGGLSFVPMDKSRLAEDVAVVTGVVAFPGMAKENLGNAAADVGAGGSTTEATTSFLELTG